VPWSKVALLREVLGSFELALWIDADAVVVDPRRDIADELRADSFLALVEHRFDGHRMPNAGVLVLRSGAPSDAFLEGVWGATRYLHHPWWEQAAVLEALGYAVPPWSWGRGLAAPVQRRLERLGWHPWRCGPRRETAARSATTLLSNEWNSIWKDRAAHPRIRHHPGEAHADRLAQMHEEVAAALRVDGP
jgi:hypothetical protein